MMKFLAVSTNSGDPRPFLEQEAAAVSDLLESGRVLHVWPKRDWSGAVLIVEAADEAAARATVDGLPLVRNGVTSFALTALADAP